MMDLMPSATTSPRRSGHIVPRPPIMMPRLPKLAKPHSAYVSSSRLRSDSPVLFAKSMYATSSLMIVLVPSKAPAAGALLGTKTIINELVAYIDLAKSTGLSERSRLLLTYALCGFANFGSLGIMIGGLGTMCPERRGEVVALGIKSIIAGTLATCLTAATVALLV